MRSPDKKVEKSERMLMVDDEGEEPNGKLPIFLLPHVPHLGPEKSTFQKIRSARDKCPSWSE
jgi:hypothetical protein